MFRLFLSRASLDIEMTPPCLTVSVQQGIARRRRRWWRIFNTKAKLMYWRTEVADEKTLVRFDQVFDSLDGVIMSTLSKKVVWLKTSRSIVSENQESRKSEKIGEESG